MREKQKKKKWQVVLVFCLAAAVVTAGVLLFFRIRRSSAASGGYGMFSWNAEAMDAAQEEALADCIRQAGVTEIYQEFPQELLQEEAAAFVKRMHQKRVAVYAAFGKPDWAYEGQREDLLRNLTRITDYNEGRKKKERIQGVMVDVEPYLLPEWDEGEEARSALMKEYLGNMEKAYDLAAENGLTFLVCIPTFFDVTNEDIFKELVEQACDGVAVMNYNRTDEYGQIAKEVGYAREYGKEVICIYELQRSGTHDLEEINTYAGEGLDALWESAASLKQRFGYGQLRFAYHYYEPLAELLKGN